VKVLSTELPGVLIIEPVDFRDPRGFFLETYHELRYQAAGIPQRFVQHNHSHSLPGTLRGLHYQLEHPQGKLVQCVRGSVYDVAVDIRRGSATFGRWVAVELSESNHRQLYIPPGFAHGFCVPSVESDVMYKCTDFYHAGDEHGVSWNDPALAIDWPVKAPLLSERDKKYPPLDFRRTDLPVHVAE
jgi:dTDP-4-dehydrorhamnose 3,5-epimerase